MLHDSSINPKCSVHQGKKENRLSCDCIMLKTTVQFFLTVIISPPLPSEDSALFATLAI